MILCNRDSKITVPIFLVSFISVATSIPLDTTPVKTQLRQESAAIEAINAAETPSETLEGVAVLLASIFKGLSDIPVNAINAAKPKPQEAPVQQVVPVTTGQNVAPQIQPQVEPVRIAATAQAAVITPSTPAITSAAPTSPPSTASPDEEVTEIVPEAGEDVDEDNEAKI
ncbi:uncharacterized protein LOC110858235 [Folsomia candida]|uniref:Uncharacterized protein n=1 Tax=Folsomia candida TaxID=158441 RepID=A0A226F473_FOLCA|nr:uncharacterized protein LOC110858235 [Folsomia candida]OXA63716.1 hypothetical protein Fcan01_01546 [Folsomia candida]